jgi:hypothetical protein
VHSAPQQSSIPVDGPHLYSPGAGETRRIRDESDASPARSLPASVPVSGSKEKRTVSPGCSPHARLTCSATCSGANTSITVACQQLHSVAPSLSRPSTHARRTNKVDADERLPAFLRTVTLRLHAGGKRLGGTRQGLGADVVHIHKHATVVAQANEDGADAGCERGQRGGRNASEANRTGRVGAGKTLRTNRDSSEGTCARGPARTETPV